VNVVVIDVWERYLLVGDRGIALAVGVDALEAVGQGLDSNGNLDKVIKRDIAVS